jgi:hypothetical protein
MDHATIEEGPQEAESAALANALLGDVGQFCQEAGVVLGKPNPVVLAHEFGCPGEFPGLGLAHGGKERNLIGGLVGHDGIEWHRCPPSLPACIPR